MRISSANIRELIKAQQLIRPVIDPDAPIEASKYDLTVGKIFVADGYNARSFIGRKLRRLAQMREIPAESFGDINLDPDSCADMGWVLREGIYFVQSAETVTMPLWLSALVVSRTSVFRAGCLLSGSIVDPGFSGNILVRLEVPEFHTLILERGSKVMSLAFHTIGTIESTTPGELDEMEFRHSLICNEHYRGIWSGDKVTTDGTERGS